MTTNTPHTEPSGQALPVGTRLEEFVIECVLGSGGFGITYLARDVRLDRRVVIKENLPVQFCFRDTRSLTVAPRHTQGEDQENFAWSLDNFSKEAAMLASLDHPGIVKVLRSFEAFGTAYFVMPFVEGMALDELVKARSGEPFSEEELRSLLERVLGALSYLHDRGIYHRDIKPGNILITNDGVPMLIDFGSARQRLSERSMTVVESAGYTPFEQLQSRGNVGPWSDLYALGATVARAITDEVLPKAMDRMRRDPFEPLTEREALKDRYPRPLLASIDKAVRVDEDTRWQDAREWQGALAGEEQGQQEVPAPAPRPPEPVPRGVEPSSTPAAPLLRRGSASVGGKKEPIRAIHIAAVLLVGAAVLAGLLKSSDGESVALDESNLSAVSDSPGVLGVVAPPQPASAPQVGSFIITSQPSGATVVGIDGRSHGITPKTIPDLPAGVQATFNLELPGYAHRSVSEVPQAGETLRLPMVTLSPLPQNVRITSTPSGAEVWDGNRRFDKATTATISNITPGRRVSFVLRKEGYEDATVSGMVKVGETLELSGILQEKPPSMSLASGEVGDELKFQIGGGEEIVMKYVPGGRFQMGSPRGETDREDDEDQVWVTLSSHFWMGETEVTQGQWVAVMGSNPSHFKDGDWKNLPVESVSWNDTQEFIKKLNAESPQGESWKWSLPTEAQWERACRGGTITATAFGNSLSSREANFNGNYPYGGASLGPYLQKTAPVKNYEPNAYGLYDMHGNVWEWCADGYQNALSGGVNPLISAGSIRVIRGGSWHGYGGNCRSSYRHKYASAPRFKNLGFRLVILHSHYETEALTEPVIRPHPDSDIEYQRRYLEYLKKLRDSGTGP